MFVMTEFTRNNQDKDGLNIKRNLFSVRTLIGFILAAAIIYIFLRKFDLRSAADSLAKANVGYLLLAFAVYYLSLPFRGDRWRRLLAPAGYKIETSPLTHYYFLAWFVNALLPARIGDVYRGYLLKKNRQVPLSLSLGTIFSERVFDLVITAALMVLSGAYFWSVLKGGREANYLAWALGGIAAIALIFALTIHFLPAIAARLPDKWRIKFDLFHTGLFRSPSLLPVIIFMTLVIWLSEALRLYLVFQAFGINAGILVALFISQASLILMSIPMSPAGLGLVELLMLKILTTINLTPSLAGAVTIADRMISYWSLLLLGGVVYLLSPRTR